MTIVAVKFSILKLPRVCLSPLFFSLANWLLEGLGWVVAKATATIIGAMVDML